MEIKEVAHMKIGEKIRNAREDMDLSQAEVSAQIPMNQSNYSKDLQEPNMEQLRRICQILKLDPRFLLDLEGFDFVSASDIRLLRDVKDFLKKHSSLS